MSAACTAHVVRAGLRVGPFYVHHLQRGPGQRWWCECERCGDRRLFPGRLLHAACTAPDNVTLVCTSKVCQGWQLLNRVQRERMAARKAHDARVLATTGVDRNARMQAAIHDRAIEREPHLLSEALDEAGFPAPDDPAAHELLTRGPQW